MGRGCDIKEREKSINKKLIVFSLDVKNRIFDIR